MDRYGIALGKKPKEIELKKKPRNSVPKDLKQAHFTDAKVMVDYMAEIGGSWIPVDHLYFEEVIPLLGYKSEDEIVVIGVGDYHQTKSSILEKIRKRIDKEQVLYFSTCEVFFGPV